MLHTKIIIFLMATGMISVNVIGVYQKLDNILEGMH